MKPAPINTESGTLPYMPTCHIINQRLATSKTSSKNYSLKRNDYLFNVTFELLLLKTKNK